MGLKELIFGRTNRAYEFAATTAQTEMANPQSQQAEQDYGAIVARVSYLLETPEMDQFLVSHKEMQDFIPAFQKVIRTTNISPREAEIMWLNYKIMFLTKKQTIPRTDYEQVISLFQAFEILADSIISDAKNGWKGHLSTESVRRVEVALNKKEHNTR